MFQVSYVVIFCMFFCVYGKEKDEEFEDLLSNNEQKSVNYRPWWWNIDHSAENNQKRVAEILDQITGTLKNYRKSNSQVAGDVKKNSEELLRSEKKDEETAEVPYFFRRAADKVPYFFRRSADEVPYFFRRSAEEVPYFFRRTAENVPYFFRRSANKVPYFFRRSADKVPYFFRRSAEEVPYFFRRSADNVPYFFRRSADDVPYFFRRSSDDVPYFFRRSSDDVPYFFRRSSDDVPYFFRRSSDDVPYLFSRTNDNNLYSKETSSSFEKSADENLNNADAVKKNLKPTKRMWYMNRWGKEYGKDRVASSDSTNNQVQKAISDVMSWLNQKKDSEDKQQQQQKKENESENKRESKADKSA